MTYSTVHSFFGGGLIPTRPVAFPQTRSPVKIKAIAIWRICIGRGVACPLRKAACSATGPRV